MIRVTHARWIVVLWLILLGGSVTVIAATDEEKCQRSKIRALGKRLSCIAQQVGREVTGNSADAVKCEERFEKALRKADEKAARKGVSCRWLENGDGTAIDLNTGLQWALKTDDGLIHDGRMGFQWSKDGSNPDGSLFVEYLGTLNAGSSPDGEATRGCFAGKCDWRLPLIEELAELEDMSAAGCGAGGACTSLPGVLYEGQSFLSNTTVEGTADSIYTGGWFAGFGFEIAAWLKFKFHAECPPHCVSAIAVRDWNRGR